MPSPGMHDPRAFEQPVSYRYGDIVSPHIHFEEPLVLEDRHFVECIRSRSTPLSDAASGMNVVAVLEAIDRSLATQRPLEVEPPCGSLQNVPLSKSA